MQTVNIETVHRTTYTVCPECRAHVKGEDLEDHLDRCIVLNTDSDEALLARLA